jgi:protein TonB
VSAENQASAVLPQAESTERIPEFRETQPSVPATAAPVPEFTFGGTLSSESKPASGGSKKLALVAVAVVVLGAGSYAAWMHWGQSNEIANAPVPRVAPQVQTPAAVPQTSKPAHVEPSAASDSTISATTEKEESHSSKATVGNDSSKPSPSSVLANKAPAAKEEAAPIVIKNNLTKLVAKPVASAEAPAVSMSGIAPADNGGLPNLLDNHSSTPTPVLQTVNVSKGVSQGLLFKQVQPKYPSNALRLRIEGAVELMATISKSGSISAVSVISGDPQLAHAALDAVKQWKYKPYLLNGSPVEIQTQITVKFKLPN